MPGKQGLGTGNISMQASEGLEKPGTIKGWGSATIPSGWLELTGQVVLRADYPGLFGVFSTTFNTGGELGTQFRLPDCRGRSVIGVGTYTDPVSGSISRTLGQSLGAEKHQLSVGEMPAHSHTYGSSAADALQAGSNSAQFNAGNSFSTNTQGGNGSHNNMQPSLAMTMIVKT